MGTSINFISPDPYIGFTEGDLVDRFGKHGQLNADGLSRE